LLVSCGSSNEVEDWDEFKVYYFDQVEHYSANVAEDSLSSLSDAERSKPKTQRFEEVIEGRTPKSIADTLFLEKSADPNETKWICMPVYNSVLVFRKENKITGIAKNCFGCNEIHIVGTEAENGSFWLLSWL
jgi:hypothetical protein